MCRKIVLVCALCLLALLPAGCAGESVPEPPMGDPPAGEQISQSGPSDAGAAAPNTAGAAAENGGEAPEPPGGALEDTGNTPENGGSDVPDAIPDESSVPQFTPYEFGVPLEESEPVADDSFFDTAVFLGDSRTEGFQLWGGIHTGEYFWHRGITVYGTDSSRCTFEVDGEELTMVGALGKKQYDSVYIMIGINDLGDTARRFETGLGTFLDKVMEAQPTAVIYLQTLPPINDELGAKYLYEWETNANVTALNEVVVRVAAEKQVVLLDTAEIYRGEDGQLPIEMTGDGCHFNSAYYAMWGDYLRCHTMDPGRYFYSRELAAQPEEQAP